VDTRAAGVNRPLTGRACRTGPLLRFAAKFREPFAGKLDGPGERVEVLPDRMLLQVADGDAALADLHARGLSPANVLVRRSSLEDVFLHLTGRTLVD
jgi:lipooligosaccharide transport system ATP-binding protein